MTYVYNPFTNNLDDAGSGGGGGGDVSGSGISTDDALVRWDGTDGTTIKNSTAILDDSGNLTTNSIALTVNLAIADGGTAASTAAGARSNLGLGSIATQDSSNVTITGGSITGISDLAVEDGGTGVSSFTAYAVICGGVNSADDLQSVASVGTSGQVLTSNGAGSLPTFEDASTGTVTSVSGTADRITSTGGTDPVIDIAATYVGQTSITTLGTITTGTWTATDIAVADGGTGASSAGDARTNLGLVIGTDVQAHDAGLDDISGLAVTNGNFIVGDGGNWVAESGSTARTSLGLGSIATQDANNVTISGGSVTGITDLVVADGGTGVSSFTAYAVVCGGTTSTGALQSIAGVGTSGQVLTSNGASSLPTFQDAGGGGAWELISTATASNDATVDFTGLSSTHSMYEVVITNLIPETDSEHPGMRTSTDNGSTFDSGSSDYDWTLELNSSSWIQQDDVGGDSLLALANTSNGIGNDTSEAGFFSVKISNHATTNFTVVNFIGSYQRAAGVISYTNGAGMRNSGADVDAIQFLFAAGNITSGTFRLYGLKAS